jgi:hypothetical protein
MHLTLPGNHILINNLKLLLKTIKIKTKTHLVIDTITNETMFVGTYDGYVN